MTIENSTILQTSNQLQLKEQSSNETFSSHFEESIQTLEDVRIKHGIEQNIIDDFLQTSKVGNSASLQTKNIDNLYNPLTSKANNENSLTFVDEFTNQSITIELTQDNAQKLKDHFGSLEGAKEMVKTWYNDAAYGVGYLEHDTDQNGIISETEALKLKSLVDLGSDNGYMSIEDGIEGHEKQMEFLRQFGFINNINDFINHSISQDRDFDGSLSNKELLGENVAQAVDTILSNEKIDIFAFNEIVSQKIQTLHSSDYVALARSSKDSLVDTILQEI
jgi:hypothetical protein